MKKKKKSKTRTSIIFYFFCDQIYLIFLIRLHKKKNGKKVLKWQEKKNHVQFI